MDFSNLIYIKRPLHWSLGPGEFPKLPPSGAGFQFILSCSHVAKPPFRFSFPVVFMDHAFFTTHLKKKKTLAEVLLTYIYIALAGWHHHLVMDIFNLMKFKMLYPPSYLFSFPMDPFCLGWRREALIATRKRMQNLFRLFSSSSSQQT